MHLLSLLLPEAITTSDSYASRIKAKIVPSPEYYVQRRRQLKKSIIQKRHAVSTKNNIEYIKRRWIKHCDFLGKKEYLKSLHAARKEDVMIFLEWILRNSKIKKFSSLHENWRLWCQLYCKAMGRSLHAKSYQDINDYINKDLVERFNLNRSVEEKPIMNIDNLYIVLHYHWTKDTTLYPNSRQIIQLAFVLLVSAYTTSRLRALVYIEKNEQTNVQHFFGSVNEIDATKTEKINKWDLRNEDLKTLCYGQISLILLLNPSSIRDYLIMEVDLKHTKGHNKRPKKKIFLMSEVKQPFFDIVMLMVAIAFLDRAFESRIRSIEDIFASRIKSPCYSLQLRFVKEKLNMPIYRQPILTHYSISTHKIKPLKYHMYLYYLEKLSFAVGIPHAMKPYDLQHSTNKAVKSHVYTSTFQTYINQCVQSYIQATFLRIPSEDTLIKILSHQSRYINP
ncbi:unnamed protein product [Penicillium salamii]|nr:unnamed protein product [Penicillium salamii]